MSNVKVLNIKPLQEPVKVAVIIKDERHERLEPTVGDLIATLEDLEALAATPKISEQVVITLRIIARAFPSLTKDQLHALSADELNGLFNAARGEFEVESEDAEGNDKPTS